MMRNIAARHAVPRVLLQFWRQVTCVGKMKDLLLRDVSDQQLAEDTAMVVYRTILNNFLDATASLEVTLSVRPSVRLSVCLFEFGKSLPIQQRRKMA